MSVDERPRPVGRATLAAGVSESPREADIRHGIPTRDAPLRAGGIGPRLATVGIIVTALVGVAMRVWLLHGAAGALDSDESVPGLMARHFLQGHFSTFYWGQEYGGSIQIFVDAVAVWIGGSTRFALKIPQIVEVAVAAVLVWRIGRRTVGERGGVVAALMVWIWPAGYVWFSTKERGFYAALIVLGLAVILLALRLDENPRRWRDWLLAGLALGIGWWCGPQIVYTAVPAAIWLVWRLRHRIWPGVALAATTALIGAAPWLRANVHTGLKSLDTRPLSDHKDYLTHLDAILRKGVPAALGLRFSYTEYWLFPPLGPILYAVAIVGVLFAVMRLRRTSALLVITVLAFPFLAAMSPSGGYIGEGRYQIYVWPLLTLLLAGVVSSWSHRQVASVTLVIVVAAISVAGLRRLPHDVRPYAPDVTVPADMTPLVRGLERLSIRNAYADYWVAYRLDFESGERVLATPTINVRNIDYLAQARASRRPAYVFVARSATEPRFEAGLRRLGIPYGRHRFGDFAVIVPARPTTPEAVTQAAGGGTVIP